MRGERRDGEERRGLPSSPYARTWRALMETRMSHARRLNGHGLRDVQNWMTSCAAVRSDASDTASLNQ